MKPIIYLLPGHSERGSNKQYKKIVPLLRKHYYVKHIRTNWKTKRLDLYRKQVVSCIKKEKTRVSLFGFSFGAAAALLASSDVPVDNVICCSLSPVFAEDQKATWRSLRAEAPRFSVAKIRRLWGVKNLAYSKRLFAQDIARSLKGSQYVFLIGAKESKDYPAMARRAKWFAKKSGGTYVAVKNAGHAIAHSNYVAALKREL